MIPKLIKKVNGIEMIFFNKHNRKVFEEVESINQFGTDKHKLYLSDNRVFILNLPDVKSFIDKVENEDDSILELLWYMDKERDNKKSFSTQNWVINFLDSTISNAG